MKLIDLVTPEDLEVMFKEESNPEDVKLRQVGNLPPVPLTEADAQAGEDVLPYASMLEKHLHGSDFRIAMSMLHAVQWVLNKKYAAQEAN